MTNKKTNKFLTPAQAAEMLGISVATLRKYSLIVEHSTKNSGYFERNKQNNRLYTQKNLDDFNKMVELGHGPKMTLESAAKQIYPVSAATETQVSSKSNGTHNAQVANLENTIKELRANVDQQEKIIKNLNKKIKTLEAGEATKSTTEKAAATTKSSSTDSDEKYQAYLKQVRAAKAKKEKETNIDETSKQSSEKDSSLKTLVNMQVNNEKKPHWWNKFMK
ncbi:hypothetical protein [Companilactobacillus mishanensis]|uniref:hypothetical protein n=1 Tax=Companilactobacillus mishanensis TaxID=2486008 RepID=UPI001295699B|nr:hypothetical protein [Companilactobacillus mishanensis]MQS89175.1 hypothetical protein [Companilactobacillus mishanensis]